ncbi:hypothetical protein, partial [Cypionkella sp.]|uniref:hypothetical protein n=1 Tax=Cypionkella sp. TaxID=2811411 RepID=UPI002AB9AC46
RSPGAVSDDGQIVGFASTPAVRAGVAALVYVRMTDDQAKQWRGAAGVTILAEAKHTGVETPDDVYAALASDSLAMAKYDAVYPRSEVIWKDDAGVDHTSAAPFRFGQMA